MICDENGRINGVRYDELAPIFSQTDEFVDLKEQAAKFDQLSSEIAQLKKQMTEVLASNARINQDLLVQKVEL